MLGVSKFFSIVIVTFVIATGGVWLANRPAVQEPGKSQNLLSPAHWMFWLVGRDLDDELRNPKPVFDPGRRVVPSWDSGQVSDLGRYLSEEQDRRDRMSEEIRAKWGPR
jgi:hypothetical protein